jgi:hypothetical protein
VLIVVVVVVAPARPKVIVRRDQHRLKLCWRCRCPWLLQSPYGSPRRWQR